MHTLHALPNHGTPSSTVPLLNTTTPVAQAEEPEYGEAYLKAQRSRSDVLHHV
eukprot:CAMPEP_0119537668 /NCGR_PEP_ID=MMETSP1344-20130328/50284_1 /TAXON_ID=236787 /ORGANISM="Florenciella parvula, Strain CCMP2471" /LENGTH=52 /DNA_ID=CAMNT_0007580259 /DNA_START=29 /DNA_END=183 /DNA_ORIENTATION=-